MVHFFQQYWFVAFVLMAIFGTRTGSDQSESAARKQEAEDDEWFAHPMNKDGMNYKD
jgi:hypothetical protein